MHSEVGGCGSNGYKYELDNIDYDIDITVPNNLYLLEKHIDAIGMYLLDTCKKKYS